MGPGRAVLLGLLKTGQTWGRATRSEFWWFAPAGSALPITAGRWFGPEVRDIPTMLAQLGLATGFSLPLLSATARRFHDTGSSSLDLWQGIRPTRLVGLSGWLVAFGLFAISTIWAVMWGLVVLVPSMAVLLANLVIAPGLLGLMIGQLLMPPDRGSNRYGPDPREVLE